ncbi:MAG: hypothetical protein RJB38_1526 [Pseudomonadota bacterium]|jgi:uncharacterized membrane protein
MDFALFTTSGFLMVLRWMHFVFGVIWIGHLYYFNFTQGPFMAETDAATKSGVTQKLLPRALWWFRWGAMFTFISGWLYLGHRWGEMGSAFLQTSYGVTILTGAILGSLMWFNVWFIIWPNQKIVIANAQTVAQGGQANPAAPAAAASALLASRTNTLFSMPMLFFMGTASHLAIAVDATKVGTYFGALAVILGLLEANAVKGKTGPMTTVKGVIHMSVVLTVVLYFLVEVIL